MPKGKRGWYGASAAHKAAYKKGHKKCLKKKVVSHKVCADWSGSGTRKKTTKKSTRKSTAKAKPKTWAYKGRNYRYGKWPKSVKLSRKTNRLVAKPKATKKTTKKAGAKATHGKAVPNKPKVKGKVKDFVPKNTMTVGKKRYSIDRCYGKKTDYNKAVAAAKKAGKSVRTKNVKIGSRTKHCLYTRGK